MNAAEVRAALRRYWSAPDAAIVFEVARSTGHGANRHLDAVAMELWPSRGLSLHGIEIKVSVADFRRELKDPQKAEEIARFLDFFWIAAPLGLVPVLELPPAWGLLEIDGEGRAVVTKRAERTEAQSVGRPFLAAMLRAASRPVDAETLEAAVKKRERELEETFRERVTREAERVADRRSTDAKRWQDLVKAVGKDPGSFWDSDELIGAVRAVFTAGVARTWAGLRSLEASLETALKGVKAVGKEMAIPEPDTTKKRRAAA